MGLSSVKHGGISTDTIQGIAFTLLSISFFALTPSLIEISYAAGAGSFTIGAYRGFIMLLLSLGALRGLKSMPVTAKSVKVLGFLCLFYAVFIGSYHLAVKIAGPAQALIMLFTHPLLVVVIQGMRGREKLGIRHFIMAVISFAGIVVAMDPWAEGFNPLGILLGAIASVTCAIVVVLYDEAASMKVSSTFCTLIIGVALMLTLGPIAYATEGFSWPHGVQGWMAMTAAGVGVSCGLVFFVKAIAKIGTVRTCLIVNIEPIVGIVFAAVLAHEKITWSVMAGAALIIVAMIDWRSLRGLLAPRAGGEPEISQAAEVAETI